MKIFEGDIVQIKKYKCPFCNYYTLMGWPFEICNVCFWECCGIEDDNRRYNSYELDGVNSVTLIEGKKNFKPNVNTLLKDILKELLCIDDVEEDETYCYDDNYIEGLIEKIKEDVERR